MIALEKDEKYQLFIDMAKDYSSVRTKFRRFYEKDPKIIEEFATFLTDKENHQQYEISMKSVEGLWLDLSPCEMHKFVKIVVTTDAGNDFIGNSERIYKTFKDAVKNVELMELLPTELEIKELAKKFNLDVKTYGKIRFYAEFYKEQHALPIVPFSIEMIPIANEIMIQTAENIKVKDEETLELVKNDLVEFMKKKANNHPNYCLLFASGQCQIKKF